MEIDKKIVLEELKKLWRNSEEITYQELEKIQKARYGKAYYSHRTLRNKASKEGWNKERGAEILEVVEVAQNNFIQENQEVITPELLETMDEEERYKLLEKMLLVKYTPRFDDLRKKQDEILKLDITEKENLRRLKAVGEAMDEITKTIEREKKLLGMMDKKDFMKLEIEKLKLELLVTSKVNQELKQEESSQ